MDTLTLLFLALVIGLQRLFLWLASLPIRAVSFVARLGGKRTEAFRKSCDDFILDHLTPNESIF